MVKPSRTGVVDRIEHDDPNSLSKPVVVVLLDNQKVELYGVTDGLEEYAGTLQGLFRGTRKQLSEDALRSIVWAVKQRVSESPMSELSFAWLQALYPCGLVRYAEEIGDWRPRYVQR